MGAWVKYFQNSEFVQEVYRGASSPKACQLNKNHAKFTEVTTFQEVYRGAWANMLQK